MISLLSAIGLIIASLDELDILKNSAPFAKNLKSLPAASNVRSPSTSNVKSPASDIVLPFIVISSTVKVVNVPSDVI